MNVSKRSAAGEARRYSIAFGILVAATATMWTAGELNAHGLSAALGLLAVSAVKGRLVIDEFMGLRNVTWRWRGLVLGWLALVLGLIALAYWRGIH